MNADNDDIVERARKLWQRNHGHGNLDDQPTEIIQQWVMRAMINIELDQMVMSA